MVSTALSRARTDSTSDASAASCLQLRCAPLQTPTIARESLYTCGYLGVVPVLRDSLQQQGWSEGTAKITAAVSGGLLAAIASQPPDTIKTRMQVPMRMPVWNLHINHLQSRAAHCTAVAAALLLIMMCTASTLSAGVPGPH